MNNYNIPRYQHDYFLHSSFNNNEQIAESKLLNLRNSIQNISNDNNLTMNQVLSFIQEFDFFHAKLSEEELAKSKDFLVSKKVKDLQQEAYFVRKVIHLIDEAITDRKNVEHLLPLLEISLYTPHQEIHSLFVNLLFNAVRQGEADVLKKLISSGVNVKSVEYITGKRPLHIACEKGYEKVVDVLLATNPKGKHSKNGVNPILTKGKETEIHIAVRAKSEACIQKLLNHPLFGSKKLINRISSSNKTALDIAVANKSSNIVRLLINANADPSSMRTAVIQNDVETLRALLEVEIPKSLMHSLVKDSLIFGSDEVFDYFIEKGFDINGKDELGRCLIHSFFVQNYDAPKLLKITEKLLHNNADINAEDDKGHTPLYYLLNHPFLNYRADEKFNLAKRFIEMGARSDLVRNQLLPLALSCCDMVLFDHLLNVDTDLNKLDQNGLSLLHSAITSDEGNGSIIKLLIEKNANVNLPTRDGKAPLALATSPNLKMDVARVLVQNGADIKDLNLPGSWNLTDDQKVVYKNLLDLKAQLESEYYVFTHGSSRVSAFCQDIISSINPDPMKKMLRVPGTGLDFRNVSEFLQSNRFPSLQNKIRDNDINDSIISCDGLDFNKDRSESALFFSTRNRNVSNCKQLILKVSTQITNLNCFRNNHLLKVLFHSEYLLAFKQLAESKIEKGRLSVIAIKKATLQNPETNYVWRSHPFGYLCRCNRSGEYGYGQTNFINILEKHNQGIPVRCQNISNNPQYRIIASALEKDDSKYITSFDTLTNDELARYNTIIERPGKLLRQFAAIDKINQTTSINELMNCVNVNILNCQNNQQKLNQYFSALRTAINPKVEVIANNWFALHQQLDPYTKQFLETNFAQLPPPQQINNININNNIPIPIISSDDDEADEFIKILSKRNAAEVIDVDGYPVEINFLNFDDFIGEDLEPKKKKRKTVITIDD